MLTAFVHTNLIEHYGNSMILYYYCRAKDLGGRGKVVINRDEFLEDTGVGRSTFYRYLKDERLLRYADLVKGSEGGDYIIYYRSLKKLAADAMISDLGAITELEVKDLKLWRQFCTLAQALRLQEQSRFMAEMHASFRNQKCNFININELFDIAGECHDTSLPSNLWDGALITEWRIFFNTQCYTPFGGSLDGIAKQIGRTVRTVSRRLKEFPKIHQCITRPHYTNHYSFKFVDDADIQSEVRHFFKKKLPGFSKEYVFRSYTNLYLECIQLFRHNKLRQRVKSFVANALGEDLIWTSIQKTKKGYKHTPSYEATYFSSINEFS